MADALSEAMTEGPAPTEAADPAAGAGVGATAGDAMDAPRLAMYELLFDRVCAADLPDDVADVLLAAYEGDRQLAEALHGAVTTRAPSARRPAGPGEIAGIYLRSVVVEGFRGIGRETVLPLRPGPGLTLVMGRNGSGKSSFAEAAELVMTGDSFRWADRDGGAVWRGGWRNFHAGQDTETHIEVDLTVEGEHRPVTVERRWPAGDALEDGTSTVQRAGARRELLADQDWPAILATYRPFLSYAELGKLVHGRPSEMYDALHAILGLEQLVATEARLTTARKDLDARAKAVKQDLGRLREDLASCSDERAARVAAALGGRRPDLDTAESITTGTADPEPAGTLTDLTTITLPTADAVDAQVHDLREAAAAARQLAGTPPEEASRLADLLRRALEHHEAHGDGPCPVCGAGRLDQAWQAATRAEIDRQEQIAAAAVTTRTRLRDARDAARALLTAAPDALTVLTEPEADAARDHWRAWSELRTTTDPDALADGLTATHPPLVEAVTALVARAAREREMLDASWKPLAGRVAGWIGRARSVTADGPALAAVKAALTWLRATTQALREERLAPFAEQSADIWAQLRQESSVDLGPIRLEGTATRRRVAVDVTVDGVEGAALGVMSQGELHALGLALFLPRAMAATSPFRFLVIDDPVQAMDPAKVDGLARVLATVAASHQVIVFTHDDRLAEAARRLELGAEVLEVVRRERSVVEVRQVRDPVASCLDDARALTLTADLPPDVLTMLVPAFCRHALEQVFVELTRNRRLAAGARHVDVDEALWAARSTNQKAALALLDDVNRGQDVLPRLNRIGRWAGDTFQAVRAGAHGQSAGDMKPLVRDTGRLVEQLRRTA